jgi:hypothetical protein
MLLAIAIAGFGVFIVLACLGLLDSATTRIAKAVRNALERMR